MSIKKVLEKVYMCGADSLSKEEITAIANAWIETGYMRKVIAKVF
jgi:hypothetical protein